MRSAVRFQCPNRGTGRLEKLLEDIRVGKSMTYSLEEGVKELGLGGWIAGSATGAIR